jgi:hypothetical protein
VLGEWFLVRESFLVQKKTLTLLSSGVVYAHVYRGPAVPLSQVVQDVRVNFWLVVSSENAQLTMEEPELGYQIG